VDRADEYAQMLTDSAVACKGITVYPDGVLDVYVAERVGEAAILRHPETLRVETFDGSCVRVHLKPAPIPIFANALKADEPPESEPLPLPRRRWLSRFAR